MDACACDAHVCMHLRISVCMRVCAYLLVRVPERLHHVGDHFRAPAQGGEISAKERGKDRKDGVSEREGERVSERERRRERGREREMHELIER